MTRRQRHDPSGIAYANHDGVELLGDLYLPKGAETGAGAGRRARRRLGAGRAQRVPILGAVSRRARHRDVFHQLSARRQGQDVPAGRAGRTRRRAVRARQGRRVRHRPAAHRAPRRLGRRASRRARGARRRANSPAAIRSDAFASVGTGVKALIGVYGIYDLLAMWTTYQLQGGARTISRNSWARRRWRTGSSTSTPRRSAMRPMPRTRSAFCWSSAPRTIWSTASAHTDAFQLALKQAGFFVRPCVVHGAPHYWMNDPIEEPSSYSGFLAPRLMRFLAEKL